VNQATSCFLYIGTGMIWMPIPHDFGQRRMENNKIRVLFSITDILWLK